MRFIRPMALGQMLNIYIYIYTYVYMYICVLYVYIYIYIVNLSTVKWFSYKPRNIICGASLKLPFGDGADGISHTLNMFFFNHDHVVDLYMGITIRIMIFLEFL